MEHDQNVSDTVDEVPMRQARARAARTGERLEEALGATRKTEAGRQLRKLGEGPHGDERAEDWQEQIAREREAERVENELPRA